MQKFYIGTYTKNNALLEFQLNHNKLELSKKYEKIQYCSYLQILNNTIFALSENDKWDLGFLYIIDNNSIIKKVLMVLTPVIYILVKK